MLSLEDYIEPLFEKFLYHYYLGNNMEAVIETISQKIVIHCQRCDFKGEVNATKRYYIDCPECNELVYVRYLITKND